ncbi:SDR family NAD(P)-dependent oxidoreductase, partial [Bacillus thuringiensis]|uniref:SDR family NAD(P)-dependent oxidoreductase n=1 Tax=Bacillus thuringiensis TaxID=1428 RepID=UPI003BFA726B
MHSLKPLPPHPVLTLTFHVHNQYHPQKPLQQPITPFPSIHLLLNNPRYPLLPSFEHVTHQHIPNQFETNLFALINITPPLLPLLPKQKSAHIINISSPPP